MAVTTVTGIATFLTQRQHIADLTVTQASHAKQLESITLMTSDMNRTIEKLEQELPALRDAINNIQAEAILSTHELHNKAAFHKLKGELADNIIILNAALQAGNDGRLTNDLLKPEEIRHIHAAVLKRDKLEIEQSYGAIIPNIRFINNTWQLQFAFPIKENFREAALYQCHPIPTFLDNTRYTPIIESTFVAFSMLSTQYIQLTEMQAAHCIEKPSQCRSTAAMKMVKPGICGISTFFEMNESCSYYESDNLENFFLTVGNVTFFSVPNATTLHTHCTHIDHPGPEATTTIANKGILITPSGCYLQTLGESIMPHNFARHSEDKQTNSIFAPNLDLNDIFKPFTNNGTRRDIAQFTATFREFVVRSLEHLNELTDPDREIMQTTTSIFGLIISILTLVYGFYLRYCHQRIQRDQETFLPLHHQTSGSVSTAQDNTHPVKVVKGTHWSDTFPETPLQSPQFTPLTRLKTIYDTRCPSPSLTGDDSTSVNFFHWNIFT